MPSEKERKLNIIEQLKPVFSVIGKPISDKDADEIAGNTKAGNTHASAVKITEKRRKQDECLKKYSEKYEIPSGFEKLVALSLNTEDTPKAEEDNRKLLESVKTEKGKKALAGKAASALLKLDLSKLMFKGRTDEAVEYYSENYSAVELALAAPDVVKLTEYLDEGIIDSINDRFEILENADIFRLHTEAAANELYPVMSDLSEKDIGDLLSYDNSAEEEEKLRKKLNDQRLANAMMMLLVRLDEINRRMGGKYTSYSEMINAFWSNRFLIPFVHPVNENNERISFLRMCAELEKGNFVRFEPESEEIIREKYEELVPVKADEPIRLNLSKMTILDSRYMLVAPKALAAQGKGFQEECGKLAANLKESSVWYISSSGSYGKLLTLLTDTSKSLTVPNKEKIDSIIDEALGYCNKFEAEAHNKALKEKDLERLKAVMEAKMVLVGHKRTRETITELARKEHETSVNNIAKKIVVAERVGGEVVLDVKYLPSFRASSISSDEIRSPEEQRVYNYRNKLDNLEKQGGAIGRLASDTKADVAKFQNYIANKSNISPEELEKSFKGLEDTVAKLAVLEIIEHERTSRERKGEDRSIRGPIEARFDELLKHEADWNSAFASIAKTGTVCKIADDIRNNFEPAVTELTGQGNKKIASDLFDELRSNSAHKDLVSKKNIEGTGGGIGIKGPENPQPVRKI